MFLDVLEENKGKRVILATVAEGSALGYRCIMADDEVVYESGSIEPALCEEIQAEMRKADRTCYREIGTEKVFFETIDVLENSGHEVRAFCMNHEDNIDKDNLIQTKIPPYENRGGVFQTISAIKNFFFNRKVEKDFSKLVSEFVPDIIHIHIIYGRLTNAIIKVATKYNVPVVQSVHEFRLLCPNYTCLDSRGNICELCAKSLFNLNCVKKKCNKGIFSNSLLIAAECVFRDIFYNHQKKISGFIMVSKFIQDKHIKYFPEIRPKCYQIYNCIDVSLYNKYVSYGKYDSERYYLYFGRLSYEKGVLSLIDFFKDNHDSKLKIVGTGPLFTEIQEKINIESITNIEVLGYKQGPELYNLIADAYFTIVPSEWYENNPLTIIESFALGTPVIGNNIGGIPEIIINSITGYVYDYKIENDLGLHVRKANNLTREEYNCMLSSCIKMANEKFNNKKYADQILSIYNTVLKNYKSKL